MTNDEYVVFEKPFLELAMPLMERLRQTLIEAGTFGDMGPVEVVDKDISRGLGFQSKDEPDLFVELMLEDGDAHGYAGVGLNMCASIYADGVVWSPGNYTEDVSITSEEDLALRFKEADFDAIVILSMHAWDETRERNKDTAVQRRDR